MASEQASRRGAGVTSKSFIQPNTQVLCQTKKEASPLQNPKEMAVGLPRRMVRNREGIVGTIPPRKAKRLRSFPAVPIIYQNQTLIMSNQNSPKPKPKTDNDPGWPSKEEGQESGKGRKNNPPKEKQ